MGLRTTLLKNIKKKTLTLWETIDNEFEEIRTTYLHNNYGPLHLIISVKFLEKLDNIKTDITLNAALDRRKVANVRYKLIEKVRREKIK